MKTIFIRIWNWLFVKDPELGITQAQLSCLKAEHEARVALQRTAPINLTHPHPLDETDEVSNADRGW